jgi:hypothetical protein
MNEEQDVKVVTKTLDVGVAAPIAVTNEQALEIARAQNANQPKADIPLEESKSVEEIKAQITEVKQVDPTQTINVNDAQQYNQQINVQKLNEINDIVQVKQIKKENPKVVLALILVLAVIILGFFIFELPMLIDMLK